DHGWDAPARRRHDGADDHDHRASTTVVLCRDVWWIGGGHQRVTVGGSLVAKVVGGPRWVPLVVMALVVMPLASCGRQSPTATPSPSSAATPGMATATGPRADAGHNQPALRCGAGQ